MKGLGMLVAMFAAIIFGIFNFSEDRVDRAIYFSLQSIFWFLVWESFAHPTPPTAPEKADPNKKENL